MSNETAVGIRIIATLAIFSLSGTAFAVPVAGQGTWETTLQPLDLNNDNVTDAFYDTDLQITWLANANVNGLMNYHTAYSWADNLIFGGYADWRLPAFKGNEMGHLWKWELGNRGGILTNTGAFQNLVPDNYWANIGDIVGYSESARYFGMRDGQNRDWDTDVPLYAMAVRSDRVVPEPTTVALMLAGLCVLAGTSSLRHNRKYRDRMRPTELLRQ